MRRYLPTTALLLLALGAAGCTHWQTRNWDMSQLRDPRAVDLDSRLTSKGPSFDNPFGSAGLDESNSE